MATRNQGSPRIRSEWREIAAVSTKAPCKALWFAIHLWIEKPHVVNRRLCGIEVLHSSTNKDELFTSAAKEGAPKWMKTARARLCNLHPPGSPSTDLQSCAIQVRALIPRSKFFRESIEMVVSDEESLSATFIPLREKDFSYVFDEDDAVHLGEADRVQDSSATDPTEKGPKNPSSNCIYRISCEVLPSDLLFTDTCISTLRFAVLATSDEVQESASEEWLKKDLLRKLICWAEKAKPNGAVEPGNKSLRLVSIKRYAEVFSRLKEKYSQPLIADWSESTDPLKFVSEDIGIAAYLLTLWEQEQEVTGCSRQNFADLGCGNGLLVYLLASEGYFGFGVDVRRRKIWRKFEPLALLEERTFDPSTEVLPKCEWIIGNHSDELTPWIPYITARSSFSCKFFLLPCCAFDFNRKFNKPGNESEYQAYFKYLRFVCKELGFQLEEDILRIPSTKRKCFIGRQRCYPLEEHDSSESHRRTFLESRLQTNGCRFVVKPSVEPVRNCSNLPQEVKQSIINAIVTELLRCSSVSKVPSKEKWNAGGSLSLADLFGRMDAKTVIFLKSQCGGLQTFIRNHQYIFEIRNAEVRLRNYADMDRSIEKSRPNYNGKSRPCWFFTNHPDGCPVADSTCSYIHVEAA